MHASDWIAVAALAIAVISLVVALFAIYKGNRNSSVATLVMLSEAARAAWQRFLSASETQKSFELAELMNLVEVGCAILNEGSLAGVSKQLLRDYLKEVIGLISKDAYATAEIEKMFSSATTFEHIRKFYKAKRSDPLSVTIPKRWFQSQ